TTTATPAIAKTTRRISLVRLVSGCSRLPVTGISRPSTRMSYRYFRIEVKPVGRPHTPDREYAGGRAGRYTPTRCQNLSVSNDLRICFVGDSFVAGVGDPEALGWSGRLTVDAHAAGVAPTAYNLGVRRQTSTDIAGRWQAEC